MTTIDENKILLNRLDTDVKDVSKAFNRHLEIYAKNGKEMAAMANETKHLGEAIHELKELIKEEIKPLNTRLSALENWRWYILGGVVVLFVTGTAWLDIRIQDVVSELLK